MTETLSFNLKDLLDRLHPQQHTLIVGSAFIDLLIRVPQLPKSGADMTGLFEGSKVGGCAFNVADVLAKLQLPFDALLPIGEGMFAHQVRAEFVRRSYPQKIFLGRGDNGWCMTLIEEGGERTFVTMPGIETHFEPSWLKAAHVEDFDYIYISGYQTEGENAEVMLAGLQNARDDALIVYDPGTRTPYISAAFFERMEQLPVMYTLNAAEAAALTGCDSPEKAALELARRTGRPSVVTMGELGALTADKGQCLRIPGFNITPVDTVGSGDAHSGGLIAGLMCCLTLPEAVYLANAAAAYVTAHQGAACAADPQTLLNFLQQ